MVSENARRLRKNPTEAEKRLWHRLRNKQIAGLRFRRQTPIGPYIVDFFCPAAKLIVELDGGQHAFQAAEDQKRTDWLEARGYRIIRFWNNEKFDTMDGVLQSIETALDHRC